MWQTLLQLGVGMTEYTNSTLGLLLLLAAGFGGLISLVVGTIKSVRYVRAQLAISESAICRCAELVRSRLIPLMLGTMAVAGALLIAGAILGAIAYSNSTVVPPVQPPTLQKSGNPLQDAITAFLAKKGKTVKYGPDSAVMMGDESNGRGPFITRWDAIVLGPWPNVPDGFTPHQIHRLPRLYPTATPDIPKKLTVIDDFVLPVLTVDCVRFVQSGQAFIRNWPNEMATVDLRAQTKQRLDAYRQEHLTLSAKIERIRSENRRFDDIAEMLARTDHQDFVKSAQELIAGLEMLGASDLPGVNWRGLMTPYVVVFNDRIHQFDAWRGRTEEKFLAVRKELAGRLQ